MNKIFERNQKLADLPATEEQLAKIWPPWNVLPADMIRDKKRLILTGNTAGCSREHRDLQKELCKKFHYLPLNKHEYHQALIEASLWAGFMHSLQTTSQFHKTLIQSQLHYPNFDDVLTGRVAIYRAAGELNQTHPGLLTLKAPTLAKIRYLKERNSAYLQARTDAIALLRPLIFLPALHSKTDLPPEDCAVGLPHPPQNFPHHIYIARLAALRLCSPERLAEFFADTFLNLSRKQMVEFCNEYLRPSHGRERYKYQFLAPWLADNAPLFKAFELRWKDILDAAKTLFNLSAPENYRGCPADADSLKQFWKNVENQYWHGQPRRISPPTGAPSTNERRSVPPDLLTPLPFAPAAN